MKIHLDSGSAGHLIHSYETGHIKVIVPHAPAAGEAEVEKAAADGMQVISSSVIISPERLITEGLPEAFDEIGAAHFERLAELEPEIVLFGSGARLRFPAPASTAGLLRRGIGVEVMDTAAACRTYNVLMSEGRRVTAMLLMIRDEA